MPYDFFQNRDCKYFPCHTDIAPAELSCLFCFCPLYALGRGCGGRFSYDNPDGVKDCSGCDFPHRRENYHKIIERAKKLTERSKNDQ